jgi:hypothetical protein
MQGQPTARSSHRPTDRQIKPQAIPSQSNPPQIATKAPHDPPEAHATLALASPQRAAPRGDPRTERDHGAAAAREARRSALARRVAAERTGHECRNGFKQRTHGARVRFLDRGDVSAEGAQHQRTAELEVDAGDGPGTRDVGRGASQAEG